MWKCVHIQIYRYATCIHRDMLTVGSLIQTTETWHPFLLTDWLDVFAKNLVMGNLQILHIWFFMSFGSGLETSQQFYVTAWFPYSLSQLHSSRL